MDVVLKKVECGVKHRLGFSRMEDQRSVSTFVIGQVVVFVKSVYNVAWSKSVAFLVCET